VIKSLTGAMAKRYVCEACNRVCESDVVHVCDQICSDCKSSAPCIFAETRVPFKFWNKYFQSQICSDNYMRPSGPRGKKSICDRVRLCGTCDELNTDDGYSTHECYERYSINCRRNRETGQLCYMASLSPETPSSDKVLYVFMISKPPWIRHFQIRPPYT
jgi:hypothetical protein